MVELFVPLGGMAMLAVIVALVTRLIGTGLLHGTIRRALRDNPDAVPRLVEQLDRSQPWADALLGWIFIAFAVALVVLGLTEPDGDDRSELLRAALLPAIVGVFVLAFVRFARKTP
ncbi:MAG: hypothetical protein ACEQR8_00695 [Cypionkella sp.]